MLPSEYSKLIFSEFPYSPTAGQQELIHLLAEFVLSDTKQLPFFLLEGYAGTGKTTVVSALVNTLSKAEYNSVLLAPTGRAAKVLASYSKTHAFTIHKRLYRPKLDKDGYVKVSLLPNKNTRTLFIIDEASMIPDGRAQTTNAFLGSNLLEDLIEHVYTGNNCKLLFLGDGCQLPPVGIEQSPAMDIKLLKESYFLDTSYFRLANVVRQSLESGILAIATQIRSKIGVTANPLPLFGIKNQFPDVISLNGSEMQDAIQEAYSEFGRENTVVITRSNKRANMFNQAIRQRILFHENELSAGDYLMVVKNNYFWLPEESKAGFIANGDIAEVLSIRKKEELYGFHFAEATIQLVDYPDEPALDVKLLLDTLQSESPALTHEQNQQLFNEVMADYAGHNTRRKQLAALRLNPYYNALQVKHAMALTCHKTQGGQWKAVFLEKGFLSDDMLNNEYLRWLYTAVTRATHKLFLINFDDKFYES